MAIPSKLDGYTVVGIADMDFPTDGTNTVETVYVPDTVKYIKEFANNNEFHNVNNLKKVVLPEGLESIGDYAFISVPGLEEINLPSTLKYIGERAFDGCKKLDGFTIPAGAEIGTNAFNRTKKVYDMCEDAKNNGGNPYVILGDELVGYVGNDTVVTIPEGVRSIGGDLFISRTYFKEGITTVTLPDSVETIARGAFNNMPNLTTVNFGKGLKEIEMMAFESCGALNNVTLPEGLKKIDRFAFSGTNITFPSTLEMMYTDSIEYTPFFNNLPNGEHYFGSMFYHRYNFEKDENYEPGKPERQFNINVRPGTLGLMTPDIEGDWISCTYTLPDGLRYIGPNSLPYAEGDLILPDSVTYIDESEYSRSPSIPAKVLEHGLPTSLTYIGNDAFCNAGEIDISYLEIPNGVKYIGDCAFRAINQKTKMDIRLPDSLEYLGEAAFDANSIGQVTNWPAAIPTWDDFLGSCEIDNLTLPDTILNVNHLSTGFIESPTGVVNLNRTKVVTGLVAVDFSTNHWDAEKDEWVDNNMENYTATILMPNVERLVEANVSTNAKGVLALPEKRPIVIGEGYYGDNVYDEKLTIVTYNDSMLDDLVKPPVNPIDVTLSDVTRILKIALNIITPTESERVAADVDGNGKVELADAVMGLKKALGIL